MRKEQKNNSIKFPTRKEECKHRVLVMINSGYNAIWGNFRKTGNELVLIMETDTGSKSFYFTLEEYQKFSEAHPTDTLCKPIIEYMQDKALAGTLTVAYYDQKKKALHLGIGLIENTDY
jgi:hypothetical protein